MLSNSHLLEEELISNAEGESRMMTKTQLLGREEEKVKETIGATQMKPAVEEEQKPIQEPDMPAPKPDPDTERKPIVETMPVAEKAPEQIAPVQEPSTGGGGGNVTPPVQLPSNEGKPTVVINIDDVNEAQPIVPVPPVGIGDPTLDPVIGDEVGEEPIIAGGGGFFGGGGGGARASEDGEAMPMPMEESGSNWWIWAVVGVAVVGGIVVFRKKGSKFKMPELIK